jgi:hypothetical protein
LFSSWFFTSQMNLCNHCSLLWNTDLRDSDASDIDLILLSNCSIRSCSCLLSSEGLASRRSDFSMLFNKILTVVKFKGQLLDDVFSCDQLVLVTWPMLIVWCVWSTYVVYHHVFSLTAYLPILMPASKRLLIYRTKTKNKIRMKIRTHSHFSLQ